jgi:hypothetical protein
MQLLQLKPPKYVLDIILISPNFFCVFSLYNMKNSQMLFKMKEMQYDIYASARFYY